MADLILPNAHYKIELKKIGERKPREETLEGRSILSLEEAQQEANAEIKETDQSMGFGGIRTNTKTNVAYSGLTQVGKTSAMQLAIAEVLERIRAGSNEKVIIFDATNELVPFVYACVGESVPVYVLNPADARCWQWDIGKDVTGAANTIDLSRTLAKDKQGDTPFFTEGAQSLVTAVMDSFFLSVAKDKKKLDWTLRDVACATRTPKRIKAVLKGHPDYLGHVTEAFLNRSNQDVYSSLIARMKELYVVAAMWDERPKFSLRDFFSSDKGGVLILGSDDDNEATILELNRLIIERAAKLILKGRKVPDARYWFFLDEFQKLGKTDVLKRLVKDGLKRGIRIHIACQSQADVVATYGKEDTSVLFGQCGSHCMFKHGDEDSAEATIKAIGKRKLRRWVANQSISIGSQKGESESFTDTHSVTNTEGKISSTFSQAHTTGTNKSVSANLTQGLQEQIVYEPVVSSGALLNLRVGDFYCVSQFVTGTWKHRYDWQAIAPIIEAQSQDPRHAPFIERSEELFDYLRDWMPEDLIRLGLPADTIKQDEEREKPNKTAKGKEDEELEQDVVRYINGRFS